VLWQDYVQQWVTDNTNNVLLNGWLSFVNKISHWNVTCLAVWIKPNRKPNFLLTTSKQTPTWPFAGPEEVYKFRSRWFQVGGWSKKNLELQKELWQGRRRGKERTDTDVVPVKDDGLVNKGQWNHSLTITDIWNFKYIYDSIILLNMNVFRVNNILCYNCAIFLQIGQWRAVCLMTISIVLVQAVQLYTEPRTTVR
jgi:hypothetical protein